ncbi:MAG: hypothetical protein JWL80_506 [Parcubacteria group bacterium]|nr:hypothetical protein [Parcubacteria group bacterium]
MIEGQNLNFTPVHIQTMPRIREANHRMRRTPPRSSKVVLLHAINAIPWRWMVWVGQPIPEHFLDMVVNEVPRCIPIKNDDGFIGVGKSALSLEQACDGIPIEHELPHEVTNIHAWKLCHSHGIGQGAFPQPVIATGTARKCPVDSWMTDESFVSDFVRIHESVLKSGDTQLSESDKIVAGKLKSVNF